MELLRRLLDEAATVDVSTVPEPEDEPEEGETVVGILEEELRQLAGLRLTYMSRRDEALEKFEADDQNTESRREALINIRMFDLLGETFLLELIERYNVMLPRQIAVRRGWKVTVKDLPDCPKEIEVLIPVLALGNCPHGYRRPTHH